MVALFTLPLELVFFNEASFKTTLEDETNLSIYPGVISELLVDQLIFGDSPNQEPKIFSNHNNLKEIIQKEITTNWSLNVFNNLTKNVLEYLNFKSPSLSLSVDIRQLKTDLILKSEKIATEYINSLPRCTEFSKNDEISQETVNENIYQLRTCKPDEDKLTSYINLAALFFEDKINQLPQKALISVHPTENSSVGNKNFTTYSLARWVLRMVPLIAISLLIAIALLLQKNKNTSRSWIGKLLLYTSVIGLIGFLTLLIGFDQFVVLGFNRLNIRLVEGFDIFLLAMIQKIGYTTLLWVIISNICVLLIGLILLLINRFLTRTSSKDLSKTVENMIEENQTDKELQQLEEKDISFEKDLKPETLEEIEEQEENEIKTKKKK
jgi:preprotein translocase subunit SecG